MGVLVKNGKSYTGTGDLLIQPVIYSDDERCIGVWRDGKPLYQKSFTKNVTNFNTSQHFSMDIQNIDTIASIVATYNRSTGDRSMLNIDSSWCGLSSTDIWYNISSSLGNGTLIVTIQYTKTTDTAGTAAWVPTGATPIHYSLNEQVIGTWIDGKPLYQKTVIFDSEVTLSNTTWNELPKTDDIYNIVDSLVMAIGHGASANSPSGITRNLEVSCDSQTNYLRAITVRAGNDYFSAVTLQYTKTTD